jgi:hypothetical protein
VEGVTEKLGPEFGEVGGEIGGRPVGERVDQPDGVGVGARAQADED